MQMTLLLESSRQNFSAALPEGTVVRINPGVDEMPAACAGVSVSGYWLRGVVMINPNTIAIPASSTKRVQRASRSKIVGLSAMIGPFLAFACTPCAKSHINPFDVETPPLLLKNQTIGAFLFLRKRKCPRLQTCTWRRCYLAALPCAGLLKGASPAQL